MSMLGKVEREWGWLKQTNISFIFVLWNMDISGNEWADRLTGLDVVGMEREMDRVESLTTLREAGKLTM